MSYHIEFIFRTVARRKWLTSAPPIIHCLFVLKEHIARGILDVLFPLFIEIPGYIYTLFIPPSVFVL